MNNIAPYVKLVDGMDARFHAWKVSRPKFTEENLHLDEIGKMDLSLNSMKVYAFEIRSSTLFRDILFALRPIEGWALSTRSMPINRDTLKTSTEFMFNYEDDLKIDEMLERLNNGEHRDKVRDLLCMSVSTVYTITIDHRVLMAFCKSIKLLNPELFELYCELMLDAADAWKDFHESSVAPLHDYYIITDDEKRGGPRTEQVGEMVFGYYQMKTALASQFLRQHYSKVKIGFWNEIPDYFKSTHSQSDIVDVVFYTDKKSYHKLMAMRSHWVIDWSMDMWGGLISDYIKDMSTEEFWKFLPNGGGKKDPYFADVYNRVVLEDPGLPCPIMCEWPEMIYKKEEEVGSSLVIDKYKALVEDGYIIDNPNNEHRKLYLKLLAEKGIMK